MAGEAAVRVTDGAVQMHGGYRRLGEYDVQRFYREAKIVEIHEGTEEIEKKTIAREVPGKF
jgi:acyl-CoA dehydrogenase